MIPLAQLADAWSAPMWRASWQGGLAAAIVWSVCRIRPSMPARFQAWLWRLVMLKFAVVLLCTSPLEVPLLPAGQSAAWEASEPSIPLPLADESLLAAEPLTPRFVSPWLVVFFAWAVVAGWQTTRILMAFQVARRVFKTSCHCENQELIDQLAVACRSVGLATPPALWEIDGQGSPMLIGIIRPAIVLPSTTLKQLTRSERATVIAHELAHIRRGDLFWALIAALVRSAFFFHPLAWLSERQLRLTQEVAADELAITLQNHDSVNYATHLVSCVSKIGPGRVLPQMALAAAGSQQSLKRRIFAMRFMKPVSRKTVVAYGIALALIAAVGGVPWTPVPVEAADKAEQKTTIVKGNFVSFADGVLKIKSTGEKLGETTENEWKVADNTKVVSFIRDAEKVGTATEAFKLWERGAPISVTVAEGKVILVQIGRGKASDRVPEKPTEKVGDRKKVEVGKFVSFKEGTLTFKNSSDAIIEKKISENTKSQVWNDQERAYKSKDTAETLNQTKAGTVVIVSESGHVTYIGARKGQTIGTFVSFKDDRLLMLGKDFPASFTKKYGNSVHFKKFAESIPVYESIDGGDFKLVGTPSKVLSNVKEGTIITVHSEGDDNFTLIQIGVPAKK